MTHIVWDWNGTLFHDIDAVVGATNEVFRPYDIPPFDHDGFRAVYCRPIWTAYEKIIGRPLNEGEWERLDAVFHDNYHRLMLTCELAEGAMASLRAWRDAGRTQSLLSMWGHDLLVPKVGEYGIDVHFTRIDGLRAASGGPKAEHLVAHLEALNLRPDEVVLVGDSIDDALAAQYVGARAILYSGGMTSRRDLESVGVPVVDALPDALDLI